MLREELKFKKWPGGCFFDFEASRRRVGVGGGGGLKPGGGLNFW